MGWRWQGHCRGGRISRRISVSPACPIRLSRRSPWGYPTQPRTRSGEAVALAGNLTLPFNLAFALYMASLLHKYRREPEPAQSLAEEGMALCREQGFALWLGGATVHRGWALAELDRLDEGFDEARRGTEAWLATGAEVAKPHYLALLADLDRRRGQPADGLRRVDEALKVIDDLGDRFYEPEVHRVKGELTLGRHGGAGEADAEALFRGAL